MPRVCVESLAYGGDAVARLDDGRVAFIPFGCPGDTLEIEVTEDRGSFVRAAITEVVEESPHRVVAPCVYFGECGGCSWQHVDYETQLEAKTNAVRDALLRIGHIEGNVVHPCEPSPRRYGYRNKVELVCDPATERLTLGFHRAGSDRVIGIERCLLLPKPLESAPKALQGALRYTAGDEDLGISRVALRAAEHTPDVEVALWTAPRPFPRKTASVTIRSAVRTTSIVRVLAQGPSAARSIAGVEVLAGRGFWRERLDEFSYSVSAPTFFQVNTKASERLVERAIAALSPSGTDHVADIYAGAGTFTLPLAKVSGSVTSVEEQGSALRDLRRNLERAGLDAEQVSGDAAQALPGVEPFDLALLDPPRAGVARPVLEVLASAQPRAIAYVSCDPPTLARDVRVLSTAGYELEGAWPVDLFPQTWHVETAALLRRAVL